MFERVLDTILLYCQDPPTINIKHKSGIRFDRLWDKIDIIDAAGIDIGKLLKDADLVSLKTDIDLLKSSE